MRDSYTDISRLQNSYNEYYAKARKAYEDNQNRHCKEECVFLQKALECQVDLAGLTFGSEKKFHLARKDEITREIQEILKELDPAVYERWRQAKAAQSAGGRQDPGAAPEEKKTQGGGAKDDDINTEGWFREPPKHSFADVAGMEEVKSYLKECVSDTRNAALRGYLKQPKLHSFFFYGPPGCGKTFLVEAFVHELMQENYKYLTLDGAGILSKYVGDAEKIVSRLFIEAEKNAPCIVFIDEIDGVCKNRSLPNLPEYASSLTTAFLTGYNRIHSTDKPIIFIGATNYPNNVDNAMLDRVELVRIPLPDQESRKYVFRHQLGSILKLGENLDWDDMAAATEHYNMRDIKRLNSRLLYDLEKDVMARYKDENAAIEALKSGEYALSRESFEKARQSNRPTPKDSILAALDEWEKKYQDSDEEEEGEAPRPKSEIEILSESMRSLSEAISLIPRVIAALGAPSGHAGGDRAPERGGGYAPGSSPARTAPAPAAPRQGDYQGERGHAPSDSYRGGYPAEREHAPSDPYRGGYPAEREQAPSDPYRGGYQAERGHAPADPYRDAYQAGRGPAPSYGAPRRSPASDEELFYNPLKAADQASPAPAPAPEEDPDNMDYSNYFDDMFGKP